MLNGRFEHQTHSLDLADGVTEQIHLSEIGLLGGGVSYNSPFIKGNSG